MAQALPAIARIPRPGERVTRRVSVEYPRFCPGLFALERSLATLGPAGMSSHEAGSSTARSDTEGEDGTNGSVVSSEHYLEEVKASGSDDIPCRAFHLRVFPRDGQPAGDVSCGSCAFPPAPVQGEISGVDGMGPWVIIPTKVSCLLLRNHTVRIEIDCPPAESHTRWVSYCRCVGKLHKLFHCHYTVDELS